MNHARYEPDLFNPRDNPQAECEHQDTFYSLAEVPGGDVCCDCDRWVSRSVCYADEPKRLGYVSATWAWRYRDGKPWTDDSVPRPSPKEEDDVYDPTEDLTG